MSHFDWAKLPPPILTSEPGSFARRTFEVRIPRIVEDTIAANDFPPEIVRDLNALRAEILSGTIQPLKEDAPDRAFWDAQSSPYLGKTWLDVPWYWAETFFYRRVLEATRYFQPGAWDHRDPYANQKEAELKPDAGLRALHAILARMPESVEAQFNLLLHASVWGNRVDLSYNVSQNIPGSLAIEREHTNLVVDDTPRVLAHVLSRRGDQMDFICDNAGTELLFDLGLADHLLRSGLASVVKFHCKPQPFFVSDTMIKDVEAALAALSRSAESELIGLALRLEQERRVGHFTLNANPFWASCLFFFEMPAELQTELGKASLVISKGDVNYRRLLGDCHWLPTTRFESAVGIFPAPLVALRTLKGELIVGLETGQAERLRAEDPDWMVNGKRGVVQFNVPI